MDNYTLISKNVLRIYVDELIERLRNSKHVCPPAPTIPNARRCVVNKQTSLIYTVEGDTIHIVSMYDNRSDITF